MVTETKQTYIQKISARNSTAPKYVWTLRPDRLKVIYFKSAANTCIRLTCPKISNRDKSNKPVDLNNTKESLRNIVD